MEMTIIDNQGLDPDIGPQDPQFVWMSDGKPVGNAFTVNSSSANVNTVWITNTGNSNNLQVDNSGYTAGVGTITVGTTTGAGITTYPPYVPYMPGVGTPLVPGVMTSPPFMFPGIGVPDQDAQGNKIVRAPQPSLEQILVEIAKILRDGGNILEVRDIFERHKLKLMDHDGEVVFDPKKDAKLEEKNL